MNTKKRKFYIINNFYELLNSQKNSFFLITHTNTLNIHETNSLKLFCENNQIKGNYVKLNLLKKMTKNKLFLNVLEGPTKIFFFSDFASFLNFTQLSLFNKKVLPLVIFWDGQFYDYAYFVSNLNSLTISNNIENLLTSQQKLVSLFNSKINNFVVNIDTPIKQLITFLPNYIKK